MNTTNPTKAALIALCISGTFVLAVSAEAASFDCGKAQTKVEHLICDNPEISELDSKLGLVYRDVLGEANAEQKKSVIAEQKHWLKLTRDVCEKVTCLKHAYWSRQAALETYFEPRSPLFEKESDKAEAIKQVLATAPLYYSAGSSSSRNQFCTQIFDDLKQMKDINFITPVVQTMSYEDPALDKWKKQCQWAPPFNFTYQCERNIDSADADDVVDACKVGYGLPPFKLYELPPDKEPGAKRHIFYADDAYGPMNRDWKKPELGGGGFAGFQQISITQCVNVLGNHWGHDGKELDAWEGVLADAGQGGRNGKNYNSIIEYRGRYYFLVLHVKYEKYWLNIASILADHKKDKQDCDWTPINK